MNRRYQRLSLSRVSPFLNQSKSNQLNTTQINQMLVFEERGKPEYPEKNLLEQSREPTNSAHLRCRIRESNPGHIGGRRVLYHCANPAPLGTVAIQLTKFKHKLDHNHKQMTEQFLLDVPVLSYRAVMVALVNTTFVFSSIRSLISQSKLE